MPSSVLETAASILRERPLVVDIRNLTEMDESGRVLLLVMQQRGVQIVETSCQSRTFGHVAVDKAILFCSPVVGHLRTFTGSSRVSSYAHSCPSGSSNPFD